MSGSSRVFCVDTSALIDGLERYYPEVTFPALWKRVAQLVEDGRLIISEEVWIEARAKDEAVKEWCGARGKDPMVVATDSKVAQQVQGILKEFPRLVSGMKGRNRADPFVIAVAKLRGAVVVTGEGSDGTDARPKIPLVCQRRGIECVRFLDIIRLEGWAF